MRQKIPTELLIDKLISYQLESCVFPPLARQGFGHLGDPDFADGMKESHCKISPGSGAVGLRYLTTGRKLDL